MLSQPPTLLNLIPAASTCQLSLSVLRLDMFLRLYYSVLPLLLATAVYLNHFTLAVALPISVTLYCYLLTYMTPYPSLTLPYVP